MPLHTALLWRNNYKGIRYNIQWRIQDQTYVRLALTSHKYVTFQALLSRYCSRTIDHHQHVSIFSVKKS